MKQPPLMPIVRPMKSFSWSCCIAACYSIPALRVSCSHRVANTTMVERCYTGTETELREAKSPYASRPCLRSCEACVEPFVSTRHGLAQTRISRRL